MICRGTYTHLLIITHYGHALTHTIPTNMNKSYASTKRQKSNMSSWRGGSAVETLVMQAEPM